MPPITDGPKLCIGISEDEATVGEGVVEEGRRKKDGGLGGSVLTQSSYDLVVSH